MTEEKIELSNEELELLQKHADELGVSLEEAAQRAMNEGVGSVLTDISPSSMAMKKILRDSKVPNK
ncbi:hypothetical protein [Alteromonas mediterranea]|uniref:hypothetical protein n=1 Tax=Alteromonas mediterranea TaxID=314275 RepID=UPI00241C759B|nr:hypothetical protein [Alteromonas mediterranea]|tara:strand:- start:136 stop:333 length:198 start_codon:yes stop_codon:yes gene_type:complete